MEQLIRQNDGSFWSCGCATFSLYHQVGHWRLPVAVKCRIGSLKATDIALLDTGAEWSVIGGDIVETIQDDLYSPTETFAISTRMGRIEGTLYRLEISLLAEHNWGRDITVDGSVFVSKDWPGPIVLGYCGFLERIRFALDPGSGPDNEQKFYFGFVG